MTSSRMPIRSLCSSPARDRKVLRSTQNPVPHYSVLASSFRAFPEMTLQKPIHPIETRVHTRPQPSGEPGAHNGWRHGDLDVGHQVRGPAHRIHVAIPDLALRSRWWDAGRIGKDACFGDMACPRGIKRLLTTPATPSAPRAGLDVVVNTCPPRKLQPWWRTDVSTHLPGGFLRSFPQHLVGPFHRFW